MTRIIAVDFDNTLFKTDWPDILEPNIDIIERAKEEQKNGAKLILWTCRVDTHLDAAVEACRAFGLIFDAVNENLPEIIEAFEGDCRKIVATEYWDDLAVNPFKT